MTADVSVIIAAYNVAPYIGRAVESALAQRGVSVEVIVVDDCSTDSTGIVLAGITDPRVGTIRLPRNQGPAAARNAAIAVATAPWIAVLDGDDLMIPDRLANMLVVAQTEQAEIVVDNILIRPDYGKEFLLFTPQAFARQPLLDLERLIRGNTYFACEHPLGWLKPVFSTAFVRRHNLAYDPALCIGEDYMFLAEVLACGARCAVVTRAGYIYIRRAGSVSYLLTEADLDLMEQADERFRARYQLDPASCRALQGRQSAIHEMRNYIRFANGLKQRDWLAVAAVLGRQPKAARHLWRPLWIRLCRLPRLRSRASRLSAAGVADQ